MPIDRSIRDSKAQVEWVDLNPERERGPTQQTILTETGGRRW